MSRLLRCSVLEEVVDGAGGGVARRLLRLGSRCGLWGCLLRGDGGLLGDSRKGGDRNHLGDRYGRDNFFDGLRDVNRLWWGSE